MWKKGFFKNIILVLIVGILAVVLFLTHIKSDFGVLLPSNNDDTRKSDKYNDINSTNKDVDLSLIEVNEEFFNSMEEKELLHYKVINAIDFFDTAEGEIVRYGVYNNDTTKYTIDIKNDRSLIHQESNEKNIDSIFNNYNCIELDNINNTYQNIKVLTQDDVELSMPNNLKISDLRKLKPKQRYNKDGTILSRFSELLIDPAVSKSILSESLMGMYMKDYDWWSIEESKEFIGRQCIKISGKKGLVDTKSKAEKYTALIDTETGIILKYDEMTAEDKIVDGFETKYIKYNETYDSKLFEVSSEYYTEKIFKGK